MTGDIKKLEGDFEVSRAENGGFVLHLGLRYGAREMIPRHVFAASNASDFMAMLGLALNVTPEQVARARDRLAPADARAGVMDKDAGLPTADQVRGILEEPA